MLTTRVVMSLRREHGLWVVWGSCFFGRGFEWIGTSGALGMGG